MYNCRQKSSSSLYLRMFNIEFTTIINQLQNCVFFFTVVNILLPKPLQLSTKNNKINMVVTCVQSTKPTPPKKFQFILLEFHGLDFPARNNLHHHHHHLKSAHILQFIPRGEPARNNLTKMRPKILKCTLNSPLSNTSSNSNVS